MKQITLTPLYFRQIVRGGQLKFFYRSLFPIDSIIGEDIVVAQRDNKTNHLGATLAICKIIHSQRTNPTDKDNSYQTITLMLVSLLDEV